MTYIISPVTFYDSDDLLWWTTIGKNKGEMDTYCKVAGKTITESRRKAYKILYFLNNNVKDLM